MKKNKACLGGREEWDGGRDSILLIREMREDLSEKMTLEQGLM